MLLVRTVKFESCFLLSLRIQPPLHAPTRLLNAASGSERREVAVFAGYFLLGLEFTLGKIELLHTG